MERYRSTVGGNRLPILNRAMVFEHKQVKIPRSSIHNSLNVPFEQRLVGVQNTIHREINHCPPNNKITPTSARANRLPSLDGHLITIYSPNSCKLWCEIL